MRTRTAQTGKVHTLSDAISCDASMLAMLYVTLVVPMPNVAGHGGTDVSVTGVPLDVCICGRVHMPVTGAVVARTYCEGQAVVNVVCVTVNGTEVLHGPALMLDAFSTQMTRLSVAVIHPWTGNVTLTDPSRRPVANCSPSMENRPDGVTVKLNVSGRSDVAETLAIAPRNPSHSNQLYAPCANTGGAVTSARIEQLSR